MRMSRHLVLLGSVGLVATLVSTHPSLAQSAASETGTASNEVFLGQTGDTNTVTITQTGSGHLVGGNSDTLQLNQLGDRNTVTILQVGADSGIGRRNMIGQPGGLTGLVGTATGLFQRGDNNGLDIIQRSRRDAEGSQIGAIEQNAPSRSGLMPADGSANRATIRQTGGEYLPLSSDRGDSTGVARHVIREISQTYRPMAINVAPNTIDVSQTGERQEVGQLRQAGTGNSLTLTQEGLANSLRISKQIGENNLSSIRLTGQSNTLGNAEQDGVSNRVSLRVDGSGNFIDQTVQAGLGGVGEGRGNVITASIVGDDNGGEGTGGYRALSAQETVAGAFASSLEQYGDGNALSLTIGAEGIGRADGNYFSSAQRGSDNAAYGLMTGDGNEFALSQDGDGNQLDITQASSVIRSTGDSTRAGNTAHLQQIGDNNLADLKQSGAGNRLDMEIGGDRNLLATSQTGSGHRIDLRIEGSDNLRPEPRAGRLPTRGDALVRSIVQEGIGHVASLDITGDENVALMRQTGTRNIVSGAIKGTANTANTSQTGANQVTIFRQFGDLNYLNVRQQ
ncbi:hypothetical protein NS226_07550 [Aureimonas ureilytica]|uniref:Curlin associated repeat-containing protein n=2 Tax=Aureimonas ureilytica TaxID=401562 RepID=A0A175RAH6_9HYPH|nr:hypothetical protein NS226_07550 [Aureimonas ureilytica]